MKSCFTGLFGRFGQLKADYGEVTPVPATGDLDELRRKAAKCQACPLITVHPSSILRARDQAAKERAFADFFPADLPPGKPVEWRWLLVFPLATGCANYAGARSQAPSAPSRSIRASRWGLALFGPVLLDSIRRSALRWAGS
jgi:hypothetical protein